MHLRLSSWFRRIALGTTCLCGLGWYLHLCSDAFVASRMAAAPEILNLKRAIALEPSNAEYRDLLGRALSLPGGNLEEAIANYEAALSLNPYVARYWLDLAAAYQVEGRSREQERSLEYAVRADPKTPNVAWEAASFFLIEGNLDSAFRNFRAVLESDPASVDAALLLCWRATQDANEMLDRVLPQRADVYLSFLRVLINNRQLEPAEVVWNRLIGLKQTVSIPATFPYFRFLLEQQQVPAARLGWLQLAGLDPSLAPYLPTRENLIVNGGFEQPSLNGGFDWLYEPTAQVALGVDTSDFHQGTRSLCVSFDGQNVSESGVSQYVPVKPNTVYRFTAAYKAENLETASGPRLAAVDAYTDTIYFLSDDVVGTHPWNQLQAEFRTGPRTNLLRVKILRQPAAPLIRGKLWVDDLSLIEK